MHAANKYVGSVGIVLGSGGVLGASFHAGVLLALSEQWGIDAREADEVLGTSAGALTGAFVSAGMCPTDLMRREQGLTLSTEGKSIMARRPKPVGKRKSPQAQVAFGFAAAPHLILPALRWPGSVMPGTVMAGMLPRGQRSTGPVSETVNAIMGSQWPEHIRLRSVAVSLRTGQRHIFSRKSDVSPGEAIAASCAVPGIHKPVSLAGVDYIDGAAHSANNLDAVGRHDVIIVSAPSSGTGGSGIGPWALARQSAGRQLRREVKTVGDDCLTIVVEPDETVLAAMGTDPMAAGNRAEVAVAAHALATTLFANQTLPTAHTHSR